MYAKARIWQIPLVSRYVSASTPQTEYSKIIIGKSAM